MSAAIFTNALEQVAKGNLDFDILTCKVLLVSSIPTESNLDLWVNRSDVANEVIGTGYSVGGIAQPFTQATLDTTNNRKGIIFTNISNGWTNSTITAVGSIIYKDTGSASTDTLISFIDFGGIIASSNGSFNLIYNTPLYFSR